MAFSYLRTALLATPVLVTVAMVPNAQAAMAVIDMNVLAQAQKQVASLKTQIDTMKEQLSVATDQLDKLKEMKSVADDTLSSIGQMGNIQIPSMNFDSLANSISGAKSCLIPDYESLMPSINTQNMSFNSICDRSSAYSSGLITKSDALKSGTWEEKKETLKAISKNRVNTITDSSVKGLAQADEAIEVASETLETAQDYKQAGQSASDMNQRLQVLIEVTVAQLVAQTHTNQLLAQLLKVEASTAINSQVPVENDLAEEAEGEE